MEKYNKSGEFYVTIFEKTYPKIEEGALKTDLDKFFELKNRRDFLDTNVFS